MVERYYEYGVNADGTQWTTVYTGGQGSALWEKTFADPLGRMIKVEKPGFGGALATTVNTYNSKSQLVKTQSTGQADQIFSYDALGNQAQTGLDVDGSGDLVPDSMDRISQTDTIYTKINGDWWQQSQQWVYAEAGQDIKTSIGINRNRLTGFDTGGMGSIFGDTFDTTGESVSIDIFGNQTVSETVVDRSSHTEIRTIDYPDSNIDAQSTSVNGFMASSKSKTGVAITYQYDALGRQTGITDPRTGTSITHYDANGRVDYVQDAATNRTTFAYDPATGRKITETNALGNITRYAYNTQGQVTHTWGNAAYPVKYEYNAFGQMIAMHTYPYGCRLGRRHVPRIRTRRYHHLDLRHDPLSPRGRGPG